MSRVVVLFTILSLLGHATDRIRLPHDSPLIERIPFATSAGMAVRQVLVHSAHGRRRGLILLLEDGAVLHSLLSGGGLAQYRPVARGVDRIALQEDSLLIHHSDGRRSGYSLPSFRPLPASVVEAADVPGRSTAPPSASFGSWGFSYGTDGALFRKSVDGNVVYEIDLNIGVEKVVHVLACDNEFFIFAKLPVFQPPSMANVPSAHSTYVISRVRIEILEFLTACK